MNYSILKKISSNNILYFAFLNIFLFPLYPNNLEPSLVVLLLLASLIYYSTPRIERVNFIKNQKLFFINICLFVVLGISLCYSKNYSFGLTLIFRMSPLFIFPLIFYLIGSQGFLTKTKVLNAYKFFYFGTILLFFSFLIYFYLNGNITIFFFKHYSERINVKLGIYNLHPIYGSLYAAIALLISTILYSKNLVNKVLLIVLNIFLVFNLVLMARKSIIIVMLIFFVIYQFKFRNIKFIWKAIYVLGIFVFAVIAILFIPNITNRFNEFILLLSNLNPTGSIGLRLNILKQSFEAVSESPIFGYGIGDVKPVLQELYNKNTDIFSLKYYNSHNQYIGVWLSGGILAFISLLTMLIYNITESIKSKDIIYAAIIVLFACVLLIENILERQNGVILFSLFVNFLAFKNAVLNTADKI